MFLKLLVLALTCASVSAQGTPAPAAGAADSTVYRFESDTFLLSRAELTIGPEGAATLEVKRKNIERPIARTVVIRDETRRLVDELLGRLDFVNASTVYQTKTDHANLGAVTIAATRGGKRREVHFNSTDDKDMELLAATLRGVVTRELYAFDLENAAKYFPLDTPGILSTLKEEIARKRVTDAAALVPLLRTLENDMSLPLIARNRASELANALERPKPA